jgi:PAS domain S-box-containing protein
MRLRFAAIVESSDDAIIAKTLDGEISAWNAAAERMFGYPEHEAIGQPITLIVPPDLYEEERDILARLRAGERVEHFETVRLTRAGERIDVSLTISPLRDRHGRIVGCSKIARDITKAKQALSHTLHPPKLALMGLNAAVVGFCDELSDRHGVTIDVHCADIPKALPGDVSLCLYRVVQEALQNAVKHGGAQRAEVSLRGQVDAIALTVKDSGAGQLSIHSQPGGGTTVHAVVPVRVSRSVQP